MSVRRSALRRWIHPFSPRLLSSAFTNCYVATALFYPPFLFSLSRLPAEGKECRLQRWRTRLNQSMNTQIKSILDLSLINLPSEPLSDEAMGSFDRGHFPFSLHCYPIIID